MTQLAPYRERHRDVRWTRPETWHLTLLFLGGVAPDRLPELIALVDDSAGERSRFRVSADIGGGRRRGAEGVAWLGLSEGAASVIETADLLARRCPDGIPDGSPPKRTPAAHVTVVRRAHDAVIEDLRLGRHGRLSVAWTVDRISLVRSHLGRQGARYETLHEARLYALD